MLYRAKAGKVGRIQHAPSLLDPGVLNAFHIGLPGTKKA